eukprot:258248_1
MGDPFVAQNIALKYAQELSSLSMMGFNDQTKNLRNLMRLGDAMKVIDLYLQPPKYHGIFIGDRVIRGPDWKWGDQDGGKGLEGTVRGLRQWHPKDPRDTTTEIVILWDHGLYGNYRYGYQSAYDVQVIDRPTDEKRQEPIVVGERIQRKQPNWRWGHQDGGPNGVGTVIELYASPAPFEGGARVAVLWDHQREQYQKLAKEFMHRHPKGDDEWEYDADDDKNNDGNNDEGGDDEPGSLFMNITPEEIQKKFKFYKQNPHSVRKKRKSYNKKKYTSHFEQEEEENSSEWDEPDFEEILSRPIAKYRWSLADPKTDFGIAQDLETVQAKALPERNYLMIDDRVKRSQYFRSKRKEPKSDHGIVLKVEQSDPRRVNPDEIKGDKVYTTWSSHQSYSFKSDDGADEIVYHKRGQVFHDKWSRVKVGDRVRRGITWKTDYGEEDGGHQAKGTVVCLQYVLQVAGILVKVRWDRNSNHTNFYSWGFKDIYDLKKAPP